MEFLNDVHLMINFMEIFKVISIDSTTFKALIQFNCILYPKKEKNITFVEFQNCQSDVIGPW